MTSLLHHFLSFIPFLRDFARISSLLDKCVPPSPVLRPCHTPLHRWSSSDPPTVIVLLRSPQLPEDKGFLQSHSLVPVTPGLAVLHSVLGHSYQPGGHCPRPLGFPCLSLRLSQLRCPSGREASSGTSPQKWPSRL